MKSRFPQITIMPICAQALDMPASSMRSFVLEGDVIPRAMLSSDPSFTLLRRWSVVRAGLQLRETLFGSGVPLSSSRFLFDRCAAHALFASSMMAYLQDRHAGLSSCVVQDFVAQCTRVHVSATVLVPAHCVI